MIMCCINSCGPRKPHAEFKKEDAGYYYKILSFDEKGLNKTRWAVARISVSFSTLSDSVFWDSYNNLSDQYFVKRSISVHDRLLDKCVSRFALHDSVCTLINTKTFFTQQFNSPVPFFCRNDSVVKVLFKIVELPNEIEYLKVRTDYEMRETGRLIAFFGSRENVQEARDSLGFYWVNRPDSASPLIMPGDMVKLSYKGYFLNGRLLEQSPTGFEFVYGTPDQVLKGINYVIGRLKAGQNAKIVLPSRLAFGDKGSSDGSVPPFTPLLYEITTKE